MIFLRYSNLGLPVAITFGVLISVGPPSTRGQESPSAHEAGKPYQSWVFAIDTSLSPEAEQFNRLKSAAKMLVDSSVHPNDLIWVMPIGSNMANAKQFDIPCVNLIYKSERAAGMAKLKAAKKPPIDRIEGLTQTSARTNLKDPIESALDILHSHTQAQARYLIIGSDFIQDEAQGKASPISPRTTPGVSAKGVRVVLLVAYPRPQYLTKLGLAPAEFYHAVERQWRVHFIQLGAESVSIRLVNSVPGGD